MPIDPAHVRDERRLAIGLALIAGYVDGFGLLTLGTYLSFMSGNTTQSGADGGQGLIAGALPPATAILFFVIGVFCGTLLRLRFPGRWTRSIVLVAVGVLLGVAALGTHLELLPPLASIAGICVAMGVMNTTLSQVGHEPLNLTFVTGTLNHLGAHAALAAAHAPLKDPEGPLDSHFRRALRLGAVWVSFLGGAIVAGVSVARLGGLALLPPAALLILLALLSRPPRCRAAGGGSGTR
jgi:uncharacterized membrane protein YoaK (UPF0700 family)